MNTLSLGFVYNKVQIVWLVDKRRISFQYQKLNVNLRHEWEDIFEGIRYTIGAAFVDDRKRFGCQLSSMEPQENIGRTE